MLANRKATTILRSGRSTFGAAAAGTRAFPTLAVTLRIGLFGPVDKFVREDTDVNLALVRGGLCWWYRKYADEHSAVDRVLYEAAEAVARRGKVGLWRDPKPVPPWESRGR